MKARFHAGLGVVEARQLLMDGEGAVALPWGANTVGFLTKTSALSYIAAIILSLRR